MRYLAAAACATLAVLALPLAGALAQDSGALRIEVVDVEDHPDVRLTISVPAHPDGPRPGSVFTVTEDGAERPAEVTYAESADLQVILLLDTTGSMGGAAIAGARNAATAFLQDLPDDVGVAVLGYDTEVTVVTGFDASRDEHVAGIEGLVAGGRTAMYDAVLTAVELFPEANDDTSRAIVLLTDGEDNASERTVEDAVDALLADDVTLHSVEYRTAFTDEAAIRDMANATGGTVSEADDADALTRVYQDLASTLSSRYAVRYVSAASGTVELAVSIDHDGLDATDRRTITFPAPGDIEAPPDDEEERAEAPVVPPPPTTVSPADGTGTIALIFGAALWFIALVSLTVTLFTPRTRRAQLPHTTLGARGGHRGMTGLADRASHLADQGLRHRGYHGRLNAALERAGIELRPGEFVVLTLCGAVTAVAIGVVLHGWIVAAVLAVLALIAARVVVSVLADRRQRRFADQLGEILQLMSGSMRAGYSLLQAVDAVAREADSPASEEFSRLVVETRLGRDMSDALRAMAERMQCEDFNWVVQAIEIHREVGGDLSDVLDTVARTIRERNQIRRQVQALSAEGRLSAYVLLALPFGVGFFIYVTNRAYIAELTQGGPLGWGLIGIGLALMTIGIVWMRRLVRLRY